MLFVFYAAQKEAELFICYSAYPTFDAEYLSRRGYIMQCLTKPLPLGFAHALKLEISRKMAHKGLFPGLFISKVNVEWLHTVCTAALIRWGLKNFCCEIYGFTQLNKTGRQVNINMDKLSDVERAIQGRVLLHSEIDRCLTEQGLASVSLTGECLDFVLQQLHLEGKIAVLPGVGYENPGVLCCFRCGSKNIKRAACARCNMDCWYCEDCLLMGAARFCEPVYICRGNAEGFKTKQVAVRLKHSLTQAQETAAHKLVEFISSSSKQVCLVLAVCGAGKTEVALHGIAAALHRGQRVLYAAPRRDVVAELYPRFTEALPTTSISAVYGGSQTKYAETAVTMATTHQALRFNQRFDLVVLDEADAYPYSGCAMLKEVLNRSRKQGSRVVYLTATPDKEIYSQATGKSGTTVFIPARYHGHLLPVPKVWRIPSQTEPFKEQQLLTWLYMKGIEQNSSVFIFVPQITLAEQVARWLQEYFQDESCARYVHAKDAARDLKREEFRQGRFPFLVTTTILERGITVPNSHVLVLWADHQAVFDEGTLVQMAGRAGRTADFPYGDVIFAASVVNEAIRAAVDRINWFNGLARKRGLIEEGNNNGDNS